MNNPTDNQVVNPQVRRVIQPRGLFARPIVQPVAVVRPQYPAIRGQLDPQFLPQIVDYQTKEKPGTVVIDTNNRFLYLVMDGGKARRYGVGVGKPGFEWAGAHTVTRKQEWPDWTPPSEMLAREAAKGHYLPAHMEGGEANPLRRPRHVSRLDPLSHSRHECSLDHRQCRVIRLHPSAQ